MDHLSVTVSCSVVKRSVVLKGKNHCKSSKKTNMRNGHGHRVLKWLYPLLKVKGVLSAIRVFQILFFKSHAKSFQDSQNMVSITTINITITT